MSKQPPNPPSPEGLKKLLDGDFEPLSEALTSANERHFGIRILSDGTWHYQGTPIRRLPLVKLFSTVLRRDEEGRYWLVTPVERGLIDVDAAPFVAVEVKAEGTGRNTRLTFRTNVDDEIVACKAHPIRVEINPKTEEPTPYIHVRDNLDALITRPVFYELADIGE